jgi:GNAT superfamily N-acetyltransferase
VIVDEVLQGQGVGRRLLERALAFADARAFRETHLWTFAGLDAARALYERAGFSLSEEWRGDQWGTEVTEQRFVRPRPTSPI